MSADIREVWARAHFAVLASRREGLPKSLLEAAACGRAMVATDAPGCREIAIEGETALTVPVGDASALAAAMAKLAGDPGLRKRFGANARRLVESKFSAEAIGRGQSRSTMRLLQAMRRGRSLGRIMAMMPSRVAMEGRQPIPISFEASITNAPEMRSQSASRPNDPIRRLIAPSGILTR